MPHPNRIAYYRDRCDPPLTQADLAGLLDVHPNTVQNWERAGVARAGALLRLAQLFAERGALGDYQDALAFWRAAARGAAPPPPELRALFARRPAASPSTTALCLPLGEVPPPPHDVAPLPYPCNPRFVGREADLRVLAALLARPGAVAVICGLGGIGKTQLAVMFAYHYGAYFPGGVHWLDAADPAGLAAQVAASGGPELHPQFAALSLGRRLELVRAAWREPAPRLLIFDNCEDPAAVFEWRPPSGGCRVLVTSRTREWAGYEAAQLLDLQPLGRSASIALLRTYHTFHDDDGGALGRIAATLGDLPLALHLAGRHLAHGKVGAATYARRLERACDLRHQSFQSGGPSPTDYSQPLADTFARSYARLGDAALDRAARDMLDVIRLLAPAAPIPTLLLGEAMGLSEAQQEVAAAALEHLSEDIGLISLQIDRESLRVHPLVHAFLNEAPICQERFRGLVRAIGAQGAAASAQGVSLPEPLLYQMRYVADQARARGAPEAAELWTALAWPLANSGDFEAACRYAEGAVQLGEQTYGPEHPRTAEALNVLGLIVQITGAYHVADGHYRRALATWERAVGPECEQVAMVCNNLGFLALLRSRFAEADAFLRRSLRWRRRAAGLRTAGTARIIHNLGYLALRMARPRKAERYLQLALAIRRQVLPEPSSATGFTLALLAEARLAQGDFTAAQAYAERAQIMRYGAAGTESDASGASVALFGKIARAAGDLERAASLFEQAVGLRASMLGAGAPETLADSALLGGVYLDQGRIEEGRALLEPAIAGLRASVGEDSFYYQTAWAEYARLAALAGDACRPPAPAQARSRAISAAS